MQVSAAGGEPRPLTEAEEGTRHRWPTVVPSGRAVLYTITQGEEFWDASLDASQVAVVSLDTGDEQTLVRGAYGTATASGHLVFAREASLWAVPFDTDLLTVSGEPAPVVEGVQVSPGGWAHYALAGDGTLVYLPSVGDARNAVTDGVLGVRRRLVWVDRVTGEETPLAAPPRPYELPRVSPDGTRVAVDIADQENDIWVWDLTGETLTRLTLDAERDYSAAWTPDSRRVIFGSTRDGTGALFWRAADGTGTAERLGESDVELVDRQARLGSPGRRVPEAVTPNGSVVVVREVSENEVGLNLVTVSLSGDPVSEDLLVTEFSEWGAAVSPDGRWFAYQSDTSGEMEVYVRPFPDADSERHPISTNGGTSPLWAPDGSELFYVNDGRLLAVPVQTAPTFSRGTAAVVIDGDYGLIVDNLRRYDIDPSGERFLLVKPMSAGETGALPSLTFVLNWFEELKERVPVP